MVPSHSTRSDRRSLRRVLIANRGEIARRIQRTAHAMGIETVAVFADGDRAAPFVAEADFAFALDGVTATETYLDVDKILAIARRSGADAVHPGYGFLSENASFARAVLDAGFVWVGPQPEAIAAMGDKVEAKKRLAGSGVPLLPSIELPEDAAAEAVRDAAGEVGFPLLVKAAAGGGGKGMRVVEEASELEDAVAAAQREARSAFGDPRVFLERYVQRARHVEIQILGDAHGHLVHCFERECSIQRRHQKIIEEAPSPVLTEDLRQAMGAAAVAAGRAIDYQSTGTVEFLLEEPAEADAGHEKFWFLEMNTRLQVEHPVTEEITGLDLVREQLRVAAGEPLSMQQEDLSIDGHSIEARLYAEDPAHDFLPTTGCLVAFEAPSLSASAARLRVDSGVESGSVVGIDFDPMLAKVITHAPTRSEAALLLARSLEQLRLQGLVTNRDYLAATLRSEAFLAGDTTIDFVQRVEIAGQRRLTGRQCSDAALLATFATMAHRRSRARVLRSIPASWRNSVMPPQEAGFSVGTGEGDRDVVVRYLPRRDGRYDVWASESSNESADVDPTAAWRLRPAGEAACVTIHEVDLALHQHVVLEIDGRRVSGVVSGAKPAHASGLEVGEIWVSTGGADVRLSPLSRFPERTASDSGGGLTAPMPGKVLEVRVARGDEVEEGQLLVLLEAMKMEHRVTAPHAGTVEAVSVAAGDQVNGGALLVRIAEVDH